MGDRVAFRRAAEVGLAFAKLGLTSFGGPIAHLGFLRAECVEKRRWLDDEAYADLVALCQFLPGPTSSQVVFALGLRRAGVLGAFAASVGFLLPSAVLMIAFAYGLASFGDLEGAGWVHGLKLSAVAVVTQAVWAMSVQLCPDRPRIGLALVTAAIVSTVPGPLAQIACLAAGAVAGWRLFPHPSTDRSPSAAPRARRHLVPLVLFAVLLVAPRLAASATGSKALAVFDAFYRTGALVFGGGHVVLPLLREAVVAPGWASDDAFLAGYAAAQAVPGPMFSFAGYLGVVVHGGEHAWLGGLGGLAAIFLPSWLLLAGALPFWDRLRAKAWMQAALRGANASVVGLLLAALLTVVIRESIHTPRDIAAALIALALLTAVRAPPWAVVGASAAAGQWLL